MQKHKWSAVSIVALLVLLATYTARSVRANPDSPLHIDVPVKLAKANVVFDVGHAVLVGDEPFVLGDAHLLASDYGKGGTQGQVVMVFHGDAAYMVLNDDAYNANRHVQTGNPFGKVINGLMKEGAAIELCGATAAANRWGNADLLAGVKVNTNAMVRVTQLEQQGYTLIYE